MSLTLLLHALVSSYT